MTKKGCDGAYLRECIEKADMTPADLARALNVSPQTVSNWLSGLRDVPLKELQTMVSLGLQWSPVRLSTTAMAYLRLVSDYGKLEDQSGGGPADD